MVPPYKVLITCSTKGIGYAPAKEFLKAWDNVIICSRSAERVESAASDLKKEFGEQHVELCDVREGKDVKVLVDFACNKLKYIDIWINNAGSNAYSYKPLVETSDEALMYEAVTLPENVMDMEVEQPMLFSDVDTPKFLFGRNYQIRNSNRAILYSVRLP